MRKILFVFTFMFIGTFVYSNSLSNSKENSIEELGNCTYTLTITETYPNGMSYAYQQTFTTQASSASDFIEKAKSHVSFINSN